MSGRTLLLTSAVALSLVAAPAAAQDPAGKAPASAPRADPAPAASGPDFPAGPRCSASTASRWACWPMSAPSAESGCFTSAARMAR